MIAFIVQDILGLPTVDSKRNFPHFFPSQPRGPFAKLTRDTSLPRKPLSWTEPAQGCLLMPNYHTLNQTVGSMV